MARFINVDEYIHHMTSLANKAHEEGDSDMEMAFRMAILQIEMYVSAFGTKEIK